MHAERYQEQGNANFYAEAVRERFASGLLSELLPYPQWVVWKYQRVKGESKKPPFNPRTGTPAKPNDPTTWGSVEQALKQLATGRFSGIGFVFSSTDPFTGTDLDHCIEADGTIASWAHHIITALATYTEYSPSGTGVHLITEATLPGNGRKAGAVEMYSTGRFFTITANHVPDTPATIENRKEAQATLYTSLFPGSQPTQVNTGGGDATLWQSLERRSQALPEKPDEDVIHDALQEQRSNFVRYWTGDATLWIGIDAQRRSKSEAVFVLILMLLSRTHDNVEQTRRLFRQSGLYDEKTDRITGHDPITGQPVSYLDVTIFNALKKRSNLPMRL